MARALIVVDVQTDFCEGGALAVAGGAQAATAISDVLRGAAPDHGGEYGYAHVVATRDHHIDPGAHFSETPDFVASWPPHCVVGTAGVSLHENLDTSRIEAIFDKGEYSDGYSGFEGSAEGVALGDWLRERGVDAVDLVGIATDHCVRATALSAAEQGFVTTVRLELTVGIAHATVEKALAQMRDAGVVLVGVPVIAG